MRYYSSEYNWIFHPLSPTVSGSLPFSFWATKRQCQFTPMNMNCIAHPFVRSFVRTFVYGAYHWRHHFASRAFSLCFYPPATLYLPATLNIHISAACSASVCLCVFVMFFQKLECVDWCCCCSAMRSHIHMYSLCCCCCWLTELLCVHHTHQWYTCAPIHHSNDNMNSNSNGIVREKRDRERERQE